MGKKRLAAVLLALAMVIPLAPAIQTAAAYPDLTPVIFKVNDEIKPGDSFQIYGQGLNPSDGSLRVWARIDGEDAELKILQYDTEGGAFVTAALARKPQIPAVELPPLRGGVYEVWVESSLGTSGSLLMNEAWPYWIQWDVGYKGLDVQVIGVNFTGSRFGAPGNDAVNTRLRLVPRGGDVADGVDAAIVGTVHGLVEDVPGLEPYSVTFTVPDVPPGGYDVYITNDDGLHWGFMDSDQDFTVIDKEEGRAGNAEYGIPDGPDPLGLNVAWEVNYNYSHVVNVMDPRFGVVGDGVTDDTDAIDRAMDQLQADGGGIAWFPDGDYLARIINIPPKTILMGESRQGVRLIYTNKTDGRGNFLMSRQGASPNDFATGNYQGVTRLTLSVADDSFLPNMTIWYGDGWSSRFSRKFEGFFVSDIDQRFPVGTRGAYNNGSSGGGMVNYGFGEKYLLIQDTDLEGVRGLFVPASFDYYTSRNNKFNVVGSSNENVGAYVIVENNDIYMEADFMSDDGYYIGAQGMTLRSTFLSAHNKITNTGVFGGNEGEIVCAESAHNVTNIAYIDSVTSVSGTTFTGRPLFSNGNPIQLIPDIRTDGRPAYGYYQAVIVDGTGMGQYRKLTDYSYDPVTKEFTIAVKGEWDIVPDATSKMIVGTTCNQAVMYGNHVTNAKNMFFFYGGSIDSIIADNTGENLMGAGMTGFFVADPNVANSYMYVNYYNTIVNNRFEGASRLSDSLRILDQMAYQTQVSYRFGYTQYGYAVRGNSLKDAPYTSVPSYGEFNVSTHPQGISVSAASPFSPNPSEPGTALIKGVIIENNALENMADGIQAGTDPRGGRGGDPVTGVVVRNNALVKVTNPFNFTGARNVYQENNPVTGGAVTPVAPKISSTLSLLRPGYVGAAYSRTIYIIGTKAGTSWSVVSGSLPDGLSLVRDQVGEGLISGTPTKGGRYVFTVSVDNGAGSAQKEFEITVIDSSLKNLSVSDGTNEVVLTPAFSPTELGYTAFVPNSADTVTITMEASDAGASLTGSMTGGSAAGSAVVTKALAVGANPFTLTVTAPDGKTQTTYGLVIYRADEVPVVPPVIYKVTDEIKPRDVFYIYGCDLDSPDLSVYAEGSDGIAKKLRIVQKDELEGAYAAVDLTVSSGGVYKIWVETPAGRSNYLLLNAARPQWLQWDIGYEGLEVKAVGVNFDPARFGGAGAMAVSLKDAGGADYPMTVTGAEPYAVTFEIPAGTPPGVYDVAVSNDGVNWAVADSGQKFQVINKPAGGAGNAALGLNPGPDPLNLGVAWAAEYNYDRVADVTDPSTFGQAGLQPLQPTGSSVRDAFALTARIKLATDYLYAQGGGILYFPAGTYEVNTIDLPPKTILMGAGEGVTVIQKLALYGGDVVIDNIRATDTRQPLISSRRGGNGFAVGNYQGVTGVTLTLSDDSNCLPRFLFSIGDSNQRSAWTNPTGSIEPYAQPFGFKGFFLKDVTLDFPYKRMNDSGIYVNLPNFDNQSQPGGSLNAYDYIDKYLLIDSTTQRGFKGAFDGAAGSYVTFRNNDYNVLYRSDNVAGTYVVEEYNKFHMNPETGVGDYGRDPQLRNWGTQAMLLRTDFYAAHNEVTNAGQNTNWEAVDSDIISGDITAAPNKYNGDGWYAGRLDTTVEAIGDVLAVTGTELLVNPRRNGVNILQNIECARVNVNGEVIGKPLYGPLLAVIVSGRGVGQARRVVSYNYTTSAFTLDKEFDIRPDTTSKVYVGNLIHNAVIYDNDAQWCSSAFSFSGGAYDSVIADNYGFHTKGISNRTYFNLTNSTQASPNLIDAGPSFFVSLLNNEFDVHGRGIRNLGITSFAKYSGGDPNGLSQFGVIIKGNKIGGMAEVSNAAEQVPQGISILALGSVPVNTNMIRGALIENNYMYNFGFFSGANEVTDRITLSGAVDGVILHGNVYERTNPVSGLQSGVQSNQAVLTKQNGATNVVYYDGALSGDADLASLSVTEGAISPAFEPAVTQYALTVPADTDKIHILAAASDAKAAVEGTGKKTLSYGANVFAVKVTAEDGAEKVYTVTVTREPVFTCPVKSMLAKIAKLQQIPYTYKGQGPIAFKSSNPAVCDVTQDGLLVPMKAGIAVITISAQGFPNYVFAVTVSA